MLDMMRDQMVRLIRLFDHEGMQVFEIEIGESGLKFVVYNEDSAFPNEREATLYNELEFDISGDDYLVYASVTYKWPDIEALVETPFGHDDEDVYYRDATEDEQGNAILQMMAHLA